jgi:hypothetical protein
VSIKAAWLKDAKVDMDGLTEASFTTHRSAEREQAADEEQVSGPAGRACYLYYLNHPARPYYLNHPPSTSLNVTHQQHACRSTVFTVLSALVLPALPELFACSLVAGCRTSAALMSPHTTALQATWTGHL